jgi:holliday junction DNA helicase RuvA
MISYIDGPLAFKSPTYVVIDINGIGYHINISLYTYENVVNLERCRLLTHFIVKEDSHQLYGFFNDEERNLFRHLISISGVGPNTARMMLSSLSPEELKRAIIRGDVSLIKTIKGIGPKSAQRIVVELQDVLKKDTPADFGVVTEKTRTFEEALSAMTMLGFNKGLAEKAISKVIKDNPGSISVEELIKHALKSI